MTNMWIFSLIVLCVFINSNAQVQTESDQLDDGFKSPVVQWGDVDSKTQELRNPSDETNNASNIVGFFVPSSRMAIPPSVSGGIFQIISNPESLFELFSSSEILSRARLSPECAEDMSVFAQGLANGTDWAMRMLDAMGKPGANLGSGLTKFLGSYEECTSTIANYQRASGEVDSFHGKYCTSFIPLSPRPFGTIRLGLCLPNTCSSTDLRRMINTVQYFTNNGSVPISTRNVCQDGPKDFDAAFYVATCILAFLGFMVLAGTLCDVIIQVNDKRGCHDGVRDDLKRGKSSKDIEKSESAVIEHGRSEDREMKQNKDKDDHAIKNKFEGEQTGANKGLFVKILLAFSCYQNGAKILSTKQPGSLGAVNGIRFLSMAWVILGHTYFYAIDYDTNLFQHLGESINDWSLMAILYASPAVDTFFTLSGILVAYLSLKQLDRSGGAKRINWFMYYFHRYWRLTPAYMLVLMVGAYILPYTLSGPMWNHENMPKMGKCDESWWTNLLYVNNYVNLKKLCMGWSWYLADDMQYYWISPLFLLPLFYHFAAGILSCLALLIGSTVAVGVIAYEHRYPAQRGIILLLPPELLPKDGDYNKDLYFPSYARIGPYVIGVLTGYLMYRWKCICKMPRIVNLLGWLLAISLTTTIIYSPYSHEDSHFFTVLQSAVYFALHRTAWGVAIGWIVFACATGNGGWINQVLSWKAFIPLGRLSYCAYLIHPLVMLMFYSSRMETSYFSIYEVIYLFLFYMSLTYGLSFIVSLVFESPMMALEKVLFKADRK